MKCKPRPRMTRRRLIGCIGLSLTPITAGCLSEGESADSTIESEISIANQTELEQDVHVRVDVVSSSKSFVDESVSIPSWNHKDIVYTIPEVSEDGVTVRATVELEDPPEGLGEGDHLDAHEITFTGENDAWFSGLIMEDGEVSMSRSEV